MVQPCPCSPRSLPTSHADFLSLPPTGQVCSCSQPLHSLLPLAGTLSPLCTWLTSPFPSNSPCPKEALWITLKERPATSSQLTQLPTLSSSLPYHFSLCFPHHSSKNSACFPILALTTSASELTTLASTSSITTQTFCLCFPVPCHEHSGLSLSAALSVSPTKLGSP